MTNPFDLYQLRAFQALGQTGSFTAAARRLNLTQSAISHAVSKLESSAGVELVDRRGRGFRLTEQGSLLLRACEQVFTSLEAAAENLAHPAMNGRLRVGATVEFGCSILMRHMAPFMAENPGLEIDFILTYELLPLLLRDDVDLIIDCGEYFLAELEKLPLFRETYVVAGSRAFKAARGIASPRDLASCPILSLDKAGVWWHRFLLALPEPERPEFLRIIQVNHIRAMVNAAIAGLGALLVPTYSVLEEMARGDLVPLLPAIRPVEGRFYIYQKKSKASLQKHRRLTSYLQGINPEEFGS
ncbi:MAG: LysR family transcriptional regulator [Holophaga sp.]|nr:LysR family transcriptional regulator [Holophaga sp.]